jgi:hypothetical protein
LEVERMVKAALGRGLVGGAVVPDDPAGWARRLAVVDLVEGLVHDLKNQLTVAAAALQLARATASEARVEVILERGFDAVMRAGSLVDEMLRYARRSSAGPVAADAREALETAVASAWHRCRSRGVGLELRAADELPPVRVPGSALRLVLWRVLVALTEGAPPGTRLVADAWWAGDQVTLGLRVQPPPEPAGAEAAAAAGSEDGVVPWETQVIEALAQEAGVRLAWRPDGVDVVVQAAEA